MGNDFCRPIDRNGKFGAVFLRGGKVFNRISFSRGGFDFHEKKSFKREKSRKIYSRIRCGTFNRIYFVCGNFSATNCDSIHDGGKSGFHHVFVHNFRDFSERKFAGKIKSVRLWRSSDCICLPSTKIFPCNPAI